MDDDEIDNLERKWKICLGSILLPYIFSIINYLSGLDIIDILQVIFRAVVGFAKRFDPIELGDVPEWGLQSGVLKGLSSLKVLEDLDISVNANDKLVLSAILGARDIKVYYEWEYQLLFTFRGTVTVKPKGLGMLFEIQGEMIDAVVFSKLTKSTLMMVYGCEFDFTGLWLLNPLVKKLMSWLYKYKEEEILDKLNLLMKQNLEKQLSHVTSAINDYLNMQ